MRILVVGPGAMGTLFAGLLAIGGHSVWLLSRRTEVVTVIGQYGLRIRARGTERRVPVAATLHAADAAPADLVIMAVKAYDTLQASRDALPAMVASSLALSLQNGLGNVEAMSSVMGAERVIAGVTAHGATLLGPGHVYHAGQGDTAIAEVDGSITERLRSAGIALEQAGVETHLSASLDSLLWGKVVVNAAINPLTALLRVTNGRLLETPQTHRLMTDAAAEAASVARLLGVRLPYESPVERAEMVCRLTAANRSSMLQDIDRGTRTEIEQINGAVVREGERLRVPVPVNRLFADLVSAMHLLRE